MQALGLMDANVRDEMASMMVAGCFVQRTRGLDGRRRPWRTPLDARRRRTGSSQGNGAAGLVPETNHAVTLNDMTAVPLTSTPRVRSASRLAGVEGTASSTSVCPTVSKTRGPTVE